jgi:hypothetical protein
MIFRWGIAGLVGAPGVFDKQFFGAAFSLDNVRSFKPDTTIDHRTQLKIGGTRIELIPVARLCLPAYFIILIILEDTHEWFDDQGGDSNADHLVRTHRFPSPANSAFRGSRCPNAQARE